MVGCPYAIACCFLYSITLTTAQNAVSSGSALLPLAASPKDESRTAESRNTKNRQAAYIHEALFEQAKVVLATMSGEHMYVREALRDAMENLRDADHLISVYASPQPRETEADVTVEHGRWKVSAIWAHVVHFITGLGYTASREHALRGSHRNEGALSKSAAASARSLDILNYVPNANAPKTPQDVQEIARKFVTASEETRLRYMELNAKSASDITQDAKGLLHTSEVADSSAFVAEVASDRPLHRKAAMRMDTATWLFWVIFAALSLILLMATFVEMWRRPGRQPPSPTEVRNVLGSLASIFSVSSGQRLASSAKLRKVAFITGALIAVCTLVFALDKVGLLHRAAFAWALGLGVACVAKRLVVARLGPRLLARRKFKMVM